MKIKNKLGIGLGLQLSLSAVLGITALLGILAVNRQFQSVVEHNVPVIANARHLSKLVIDMETGQRGFCITYQDRFLEPYRAGISEFDKLIVEQKDLVSDNPIQLATLERIESLIREWKAKAAGPEIAMSRKVATHQIDVERLLDIVRRGVGKGLMDKAMALGHEIETSFSDKGDWEGAFVVELIEKCIAARESGQRGFLITGEEEYLDKYLFGEQKRLPEHFVRLRAIIAARGRNAELSEKVDELERLTIEWTRKAAEPEIAARREINRHPDSQKDVAALLEAGTGKNLIDTIRREFDDFIEIETTVAGKRYSDAIWTGAWTRNVTIAVLFLAIFVGGCVVVILGRAIARPLGEFGTRDHGNWPR